MVKPTPPVNSAASVSDQVIKSEMPLRIALLVLPAPLNLSMSLTADTPEMAKQLSVLLPDLHSAKLLETTELVSIKVDDFEANLTATIESIEQGKIVQISTETSSLLMMHSLKAAQNRIHPHAQLAAMQMQSASTALVEKSLTDTCMHKALSQAKRKSDSVSKRFDLPQLNSTEQFDAVCTLIKDLASRTHHRDAASMGPKQATSHYWFTDHHQARVVAINLTNSIKDQSDSAHSADKSCISFIVSQGTGFIAPKSIIDTKRLQFVVCADNQAGLLAELTKIKSKLTTEPGLLLTQMRDNLVSYEKSHSDTAGISRYAITLQASSIEAMLQEITAMGETLPNVMSDNSLTHSSQYRTPAGSYFTAEPLGGADQSGLAFVYPGVGTVYSDMFSQLHRYFPSLYSQLEREGDLKSMFQADAIYHLDPKVTPAMQLGDLAIAGVGSSYLLTQLLVKQFNITPNFALGYSMGEASMWASLGVWNAPHALIEKTKTDPLFTSAISGKLTAVRKAWQLTNSDADIVWNSFVVRSPAASIKALLPEFPHAYLAIVQGDTCVIAGCETQCRELLAQMKKRGIAANRVTAMHTTPAMEEHGNVEQFYNQPLEETLPNDIKFISAASGESTVSNANGGLDSQVVARSIADTFCNTLDFTALVHSAQKQGVKLFVELGADRQNCTLIDKIAKQDRQCGGESTDFPCCTVPVNAKGGDDITTLLKALGQLISHRVPLTAQPLIEGLNREIALSQLQKTTTTKQLKSEPMSNLTLQGEV
ncbi:omega-3 polyunsaturated fatty acid synthase PfaB [Shewanella sediminis HAW-EB3]|uniref:Omega-3 polyunsaturated fatty acid synthase PfaB n=1 Tax=Shewanella sediminis (strain HAW-EB3) TaxID=425104 RepID=A8FY84_SHESH|nr:PfaB family protein [Shewanella sediminis]ABV37807.1 omega-3 polyunsaturated fatty acid synthase PfaB [Shewanella sediminis HAW-EB3]